jgi:tripartite-type tricarboxylate transporter receptor subunit TctC
MRKRFEGLGADPFVLTSDAFDDYVRTQAKVAGAIIKAANIRPF